MGVVLSTFESCAATNGTSPADFMELEYQKREGRYKNNMRKKKRMDIMAVAYDYAINDIKTIMGFQSDNEEMTEQDDEYIKLC